MAAQDWLDSIGCFIGIVERNGGNKVMKDVCLNNTMHEISADEAEFAVNGGCCTAGEVPGAGFVMGKSGIGVLKEGNPYCSFSQLTPCETLENRDSPSQLFTHMYGIT